MVSRMQLIIPTVFVSIIIFGTLASFLVVSQEGIDIEFEMSMMVDSNTTLWNAGYHYFEFEGSGWFKSSVINETAYLEGNGTVDYGELVTGGNPGFPPGEFLSHFEVMGFISNNIFTGPFSIDGDYTGVTTALPGPYPEGFIYAESVENLQGSLEFVSSFADRPLNMSAELITVDFGYISFDGKNFEIRASGTFKIFPGEEEPPVIPEFPSLAVPTLLAAIPVLVRYRKRASTVTPD